MLVEYLGKENLHKYEEYLDSDAAENIGREFYRGIVCENADVPGAALIWEYENLYDSDKPTATRIEWGRVTDEKMGAFLLEAFSEIIARNKAERSYFELSRDYDREVIKLFKQAGFKITTEKTDRVVIRLSDAKAVAALRELKIPRNIKSLEELSTEDFKAAIKECINDIDREFVSDLFFLGPTWYEQDISCYVETDGRCSGLFLVHRCTSERLRVELLADWGSGASKSLLEMIRYSLDRALLAYPEDTEIDIVLRDRAIKGLAAYLFPQIRVSTCIRGDREETL